MKKLIAASRARLAARRRQQKAQRQFLLTIINQQKTIPINRPILRKVLRQVLKKYDIIAGQLNLLIVGHAEITRYKEQYFGRKISTDVISFNLGAPDDYLGGRLECDIIINAEMAADVAGRSPTRRDAELCLYAVHGLLHQLGFDDVTAAKAKKMHAREVELLTKLGLEVKKIG